MHTHKKDLKKVWAGWCKRKRERERYTTFCPLQLVQQQHNKARVKNSLFAGWKYRKTNLLIICSFLRQFSQTFSQFSTATHHMREKFAGKCVLNEFYCQDKITFGGLVYFVCSLVTSFSFKYGQQAQTPYKVSWSLVVCIERN